MTELEELREMVGKATGPDRELDVALGALWPDPPFNVTTAILRNAKPVCPAFTASIDAALALVERKLPGCRWYIGRNPEAKRECDATLEASNGTAGGADAPTAPLAILAALLDALALIVSPAREKGDRT
jgi:hypothetical protein